jgi:hypothetical protein
VEVLPGVPQSFEAIDDVCRNGTLLCNLVPLIGGPVVKGVFWKPSSHKLAVSNVAKACRYGRPTSQFSESLRCWSTVVAFSSASDCLFQRIEGPENVLAPVS